MDLLLVGDGSGTGWELASGIGWACIAVEHDGKRRVFHGAANAGTVGVAELSAYLIPLIWYREHAPDDGRVRNVHVVTDSQYVQKMASSNTPPAKHDVLWASFAWFSRGGLRLHWHWVARGTELNRLADDLSRSARTGYYSLAG